MSKTVKMSTRVDKIALTDEQKRLAAALKDYLHKNVLLAAEAATKLHALWRNDKDKLNGETWQVFLRRHVDTTRARAQQLETCWKVVQRLKAAGVEDTLLPKTEKVCRVLAMVCEDKSYEVWTAWMRVEEARISSNLRRFINKKFSTSLKGKSEVAPESSMMQLDLFRDYAASVAAPVPAPLASVPAALGADVSAPAATSAPGAEVQKLAASASAEKILAAVDAMSKDDFDLAKDWMYDHQRDITPDILDTLGFSPAADNGKRTYPSPIEQQEGFTASLYYDGRQILCRETATGKGNWKILSAIKARNTRCRSRLMVAIALMICAKTGKTPRLTMDVKQEDISIDYAGRVGAQRWNKYKVHHPALTPHLMTHLRERYLAASTGIGCYVTWMYSSEAHYVGMYKRFSGGSGEYYIKSAEPLTDKQIADIRQRIVKLAAQSVEPHGPYKAAHRRKLAAAREKKAEGVAQRASAA